MEIFTVNEVAKMLRVNPRKVYEMVDAREIEHIRLRRKILFSREQIEKYIASHTVSVKGGEKSEAI